LDLNYLFPDEQIDVPHNNEESQPETGSQDFGIVVDNNVGDLIRKLTNVDTDNEDTENLKDLEAEIAKFKETSPAPTPNPEAEKKGNGVSQTSSAPTPPSNCVSVIRLNTQAQPGKIQRASVSPREAPYTVPPNVDTENLTDLEAEIAVILTSSAPTPNPEAEKKENSLQKHRRIKKEREEVEKERTKFLIADNTRLEATIAVLEQELGLPQSQTSSTPTTREAPYTVPTKFQCDQCKFSSRSQHGLKIHTGKAHKLHTVALPLPCTTSVVYNLIPVISYILQPQPSSTLLSQNAPAFSAPATSIIPNSTAIPTPDTTPDPEPEKTENAVQKCRRIKKEKKDEDLLMTEFLIDDNTRLKATIAILEQQLGLPQSQTSSMPPTRCVTVSESNTHAHPGKIQRGSVIHRETPYTVPPKFQCDQCDFSSPSQHGLKIHTGKAHKLHTVDLSSTARDPADAKRSREYRLREKIKEDNAVEKLKSLKEQNKNLKDQEAQLRTRVEQSLFK